MADQRTQAPRGGQAESMAESSTVAVPRHKEKRQGTAPQTLWPCLEPGTVIWLQHTPAHKVKTQDKLFKRPVSLGLQGPVLTWPLHQHTLSGRSSCEGCSQQRSARCGPCPGRGKPQGGELGRGSWWGFPCPAKPDKPLPQLVPGSSRLQEILAQTSVPWHFTCKPWDVRALP